MRHRSLMVLFFAVVVIAIGASTATAQWKYIAGNSANSKSGREILFVGETKGRFREIELRVSGAGLMIERALITYANGQSRSVFLPGYIGKGRRSGSVDLPGGRRAIKTLQVWCRAVGKGRRATLSLYGRD